MNDADLKQNVRGLFTSQKLAVLATSGEDQPYCSLMAFAVTDDLKHVIVATKRQTHKYANIQQHPGVSLLVDNRKNQVDDFQQAVAVTILARAAEPDPPEHEQFLNLYLFKHPYMRSFCQSPDCALLKLTVERYLVVAAFRNFLASEDDYLEVRELRP
ncbi:MAG: pyridoxamine 5'-phosphate oxidase family protein [Deltaproteobacteria bacterium]|nr:pyridoxamine 5'-phosphate oxidase family protein [Deltaproteobacteria bacterium]